MKKSLTLFWCYYLSNFEKRWEIFFSNCVAFSQYLNFKDLARTYDHLYSCPFYNVPPVFPFKSVESGICYRWGNLRRFPVSIRPHPQNFLENNFPWFFPFSMFEICCHRTSQNFLFDFCIHLKGQEISKIFFLEIPLPKRQTKLFFEGFLP